MKISKHLLEEVLEGILVAKERGITRKQDMGISFDHFENSINISKIFSQLENDGYLRSSGDSLVLTEKGLTIAENIIRRHRLAERLLNDILSITNSEMESAACEFEHVLSPEITDAVCTFLGHPPTCPHGRAIPRGECCRKFRKEVKSLIVPLSEMEIGRRGRIAFVAPSFHERFDRLIAMGIVPGSEISVHQRRPTLLIRVGETEIAIDTKIAAEIYVKRIMESESDRM